MKNEDITIFEKHSQMKKKYQKQLGFFVKVSQRHIGKRDATKYHLPVVIGDKLKSPHLDTLEENCRHLENVIWLFASKKLAPLKVNAERIANDYQVCIANIETLETKLNKNNDQPLSFERRLGEEKTEEGLLIVRREKEQKRKVSPIMAELNHYKEELQKKIKEAAEIHRTLCELEALTREMAQMVRHHFKERISVYIEGAVRSNKQSFYKNKTSYQFGDSILENEANYYGEYMELKERLQLILTFGDKEEGEA